MEKKPIWRPISYLSMVATAINGHLSSSKEQYETLLKAKDKPYVLDNATIERIIKVFKEQESFIPYYTEQLQRWRKEELSSNQLIVVVDLEEKLPELKELTEKVLRLAHNLENYTIEKIMALDEAVLAMLHLKGEL